MKVKSKICFKYSNKKHAKIAYTSLKIDNDEGYIESFLKDNIIEYQLNNSNLGSFLNSCDDLISSEILVEEIFNKTL